MTVAVAWVRKIRDCEELVFVSDSRLSGDGRTFDSCPKIVTLPRSDCAICFAGYTGHAYPMMLQLALAIDSHAPSRRGSLDITSLKSHALKVFDSMAELIRSSLRASIRQDESPGASFLFGGYSWVQKEFKLWSIVFSSREVRFIAHPAQWILRVNRTGAVVLRRSRGAVGTEAIGRIAFAGDQASTARELLCSRLSRNTDVNAQLAVKLDMEPFGVVRDMLRNPGRSETIGGSPQIIKVYQYMQAAPLGVYWPQKEEGRVFLQGRPCLGYERIDRWILDPDTLLSESPSYSRNDVDDSPPESAEA